MSKEPSTPATAFATQNVLNGRTAPHLSPFERAVRRFCTNTPAPVCLALLCILAGACVFGPFLTPNAYDRVFPSYVHMPPSFLPHPDASQVREEAERIAARLHATLALVTQSQSSITLSLTTARALDMRSLGLFARSDLFGAPVVAPHDPGATTLILSVPIRQVTFFLGTDGNGRDLLARTLLAGGISLEIGLVASAVALLIGVAFGAVAGFAGGLVDTLMMRVVDILYAMPFIFFVILLVVFFGRNFVLVFVAIGAVEWLDMARIVRGQTLSLKTREFVTAAHALGASARAVIWRHIIPNLLGPVVVYLTLLVPRVILLESFLSFLGLGVQEPRTSLGVLIAEGAHAIEGAPYLLIVPALMLSLMLVCYNVIGDGLRDALDPRESGG